MVANFLSTKNNTMPRKFRLFTDVSKVTSGARIRLNATKLTTPDGTIVSCARLVPLLTERSIDHTDAKVAVLVELSSESPRRDIIQRLVNYISYSSKETTMVEVDKILTKPENQ